MKRYITILSSLLVGMPSFGHTSEVRSSWDLFPQASSADRCVTFRTDAIGRKLPILWGFDTAWNDYANMLRGIRYSGVDAISCARVSFQPWAEITQKGVLPDMLLKNLDSRMQTVGLIGKKVDIVLNLDGGDNTVKEVYGGYRYENPSDPWWSPKEYIGDVVAQGPKWADLIDATAASVEEKGYRVITASPLNEPDLEINGTPIELFYQIAKSLKDEKNYPRFSGIRISGGNTLNNDEADKWYEYNKEFLDEGNTHQLAGSFATYADFFRKVREDGRHATADELHNVMEAMVGVEYGMQTGIWWGSAERARGEFMKASFGERLGYSENRDAWSAASVYRNPDGGLQAFVGCSERQAKPSTFKFVSADVPFFVNGAGPFREYVANVPGDPIGAYQTELQRNAEAVFSISTGMDIQPRISGDYFIVNSAYGMAISTADGGLDDGTDIILDHYTQRKDQIWNVSDVPEDWGGDFSYSFIRNVDGDVVKSLDDNNWNLEDGGKVICWGFSGSNVQQWALEYAGDGFFRIRNKHSALYLSINPEDSQPRVVQREYADSQSQLWRFVGKGVEYEEDVPSVPESLVASANSASVRLEWQPSADAGAVTYTIARADGESGDFNVVARGLSDTEFLDNSLSADSAFRYKVMAEDLVGNRSDYSLGADVTVENRGSGLIARYTFDENLNDLTDNGFDMHLKGQVAFLDGVGEGAMSAHLHTGGFCQLPYSLLASDDFAVCFWFRAQSTQVNRCLFATGISDEESLQLYPCFDGNLRLVAKSGEGEYVLTESSLPIRTWHHLAIVADENETMLYLNGELVGDEACGAELHRCMPKERVLTFLASDINQGNACTARIADMRVFDRAITQEEICGIMAKASGVGELTMDSDASSTFYSIDGRRISRPAHGLYIERRADGTSLKRISK